MNHSINYYRVLRSFKSALVEGEAQPGDLLIKSLRLDMNCEDGSTNVVLEGILKPPTYEEAIAYELMEQ